MTQDEIIRMAREAGFGWPYVGAMKHELERFAALVAAHDREKQAEQEPIENNDWKKASYIRETLNAEQAAEPVAYRVWDRMGGISYRRTKPIESEYVEWDALYAAPVSIEAAVLAEREACAKVCDELKWHSPPNNFSENCAAAIRARSKK